MKLIYLVTLLVFFSQYSSSGLTKEELQKIVAKEGLTNSKLEGDFAIFGRTGTFNTSAIINFHETGKKIMTPIRLMKSKFVDGKYLVIATAISPTEMSYKIISVSEKNNIFKKWSLSQDGNVISYDGVAMLKKRVVSWSSIQKGKGIHDIITDYFSENGESEGRSMRLVNGKLTMSVTGMSKLIP